MSRQERVAHVRQPHRVHQHLVRLDAARICRIFAIAPAQNVGRQHLLIATQRRVIRHFRRPDIDELHNPVGSRSRSSKPPGVRTAVRPPAAAPATARSHKPTRRDGTPRSVGHRRATDPRLNQATSRPVSVAARYGTAFAGSDTYSSYFDLRCRRRLKSQLAVRQQIQRTRGCLTAGFAGARPTVVAMPGVGTGLINQHTRRVRLRAVLQVVVEEGLHDGSAEPARGIAVEENRADAAPFAAPLAVIPGSQYQVHPLTVRITAARERHTVPGRRTCLPGRTDRTQSASALWAGPSPGSCRPPVPARSCRTQDAPKLTPEPQLIQST